MPYQYDINPAPQSGQGPFGSVPGSIDLPNPYQDVNRHLPSLGPLNNAAGSDVLSQLHGQLSPETLARIQDASAAFGISSGMPGSGLQRSRTARDLGLATEQLQNQGLQNYGNLLNTVSRTQTVSPELQADIAGRNATLAAAPNPAAAASHAQQLFDQYLEGMGRTQSGPWWDRSGGYSIGGGGGGGGGGGSFGRGGAFTGNTGGGSFGGAGGFYPTSVAGGPLGTPAPGPEGTNDWLQRTFGNTRPGTGLGGGVPSGQGFYAGTQEGAPDWAQGYGSVGFGAPGSMESDLGSSLWDLAGAPTGDTGG